MIFPKDQAGSRGLLEFGQGERLNSNSPLLLAWSYGNIISAFFLPSETKLTTKCDTDH